MILRTPLAAIVSFLIATGSAWSCGKSEEAPGQAPSRPAAQAEVPDAAPAAVEPGAARADAEQIFATRCYTCHGPTGAGDGPASGGLTPPPRNFQDADWQASVTDEHIEKIIMYGGAAVGRSAAMPANPDLMAKKEVVTALRAHIRGLAR